MSDIEKRLDQMEALIRKPSFRQTKGKANEVSYWVFDYAPEDELIVRNRISFLKKKNLKETDGFELAVYDLYDLIIAHLQSKDFMEKCYAQEKKRGIRKLQDAIRHTLKITDKENLLVKYIEQESVFRCCRHQKCLTKFFTICHRRLPVYLWFYSIRELTLNRNSSYLMNIRKTIITGHSDWCDRMKRSFQISFAKMNYLLGGYGKC